MSIQNKEKLKCPRCGYNVYLHYATYQIMDLTKTKYNKPNKPQILLSKIEKKIILKLYCNLSNGKLNYKSRMILRPNLYKYRKVKFNFFNNRSWECPICGVPTVSSKIQMLKDKSEENIQFLKGK